MRTNALPRYDMSDNPTGCCPRFHTESWEDALLHFEGKSFARAETRSVMHIPVNMGSVFSRVLGKIDAHGGYGEDNFIVLSREETPWRAEHLFATEEPLEGEEMVTLSGDFFTKVFEGPYRDAKHWHYAMQAEAAKRGTANAKVWFFYTTCPKCAKVYGKNYVVGVAEL
ncbi:hydrolase [Aliiroseovarius subalbicans]|uniref:hydrolase n=1 Tax=Aliiroseovarius subalbicans TaxID=2925840 RepID=UPI001F5A09D9|nr:hydrolase [Aliiroseovarius subalbicans]MCI2399952.1 hypothetical protein [Aliiroseovarius subalbicans]